MVLGLIRGDPNIRGGARQQSMLRFGPGGIAPPTLGSGYHPWNISKLKSPYTKVEKLTSWKGNNLPEQ